MTALKINQCLWVLSFLAVLAVGAWPQKLTGLVVDTPLGRVVGWERTSRDGRVYQAWTSLPYAQPPVGQRRFKAPQTPHKWSGVLNATSDPPPCAQYSKGSEDCLYLNVYRPKNNLRNLPVLFHVPGGAFQEGDLGTRENADYLMDEDVILVAIHYRLNVFGFMSLGDQVIPGNFGLKDQVMALKWVQQNIAAFGGNRNSVTVLGESAGGASAHFMLKTPATEELVHRALSESGTINKGRSLMKTELVRNATLNIVKQVGCTRDSSQAILECLQKVNSTILLRLSGPKTGESIFVPCIEPQDADDAVVTEDLSLRPSMKPWISSFTNGEFTFYKGSTPEQEIEWASQHLVEYLEQFLRKFSQHDFTQRSLDMDINLLLQKYFPDERGYFSIKLTTMKADFGYIYPGLYNLMIHQGPKWFYHYEYSSEMGSLSKINASGHAEQRFNYFNYRSLYPGVSPEQRPTDYLVSKRMIKYLVNFAYYDDPTPPGSNFEWKQFKTHELLRVTNPQRDFYADPTFYDQLKSIVNMWFYIIGAIQLIATLFSVEYKYYGGYMSNYRYVR